MPIELKKRQQLMRDNYINTNRYKPITKLCTTPVKIKLKEIYTSIHLLFIQEFRKSVTENRDITTQRCNCSAAYRSFQRSTSSRACRL